MKTILFACMTSLHLYAGLAQGDEELPLKAYVGSPSPARVETKNSWDMNATVSYLYWFAGQDGLDLAVTELYSPDLEQIIVNTASSDTIYQNETYSSGFKLGMGWAIPTDGWVLRADYTRFHQQTSNKESLPITSGNQPVFQLTDWFYQVSMSSNQSPGCTELSSKWRLHIDWLDTVLQRPFYVGRRLTINPFMGLRASWILQTFQIELSNILNFTDLPMTAFYSHNRSHAWSLGPRFGAEGRFLLGAGMRLQGAVAANFLYNTFTKVEHSEDPLSTTTPPIKFKSIDNSNVRRMFEGNLGLGWGKYIYDQRYHVDLSATYDFNYLPEQNQMRVLDEIHIEGVNGAAKTLYLHGLTVTGTFNF